MYNMDSIGITGFYIRPKLKEVKGKVVQQNIRIELLKDGEVLETGNYDFESDEKLKGLQNYLLSVSIWNLKLENNLINAFFAAKKCREMNVVNMFKIERIGRMNDNGTQDIRVIFLRNGYFFTQSTFVAVSEQRLDEIKQFLRDNTRHNLTCTEQCRTVTVLDMVAVIDHMLKS